MGLIAAIAGLALLGVALADLLWTSLWVSGKAGPLTGRVSSLAWRLVVDRLVGHHRALSIFGPASIAGAIVLWSLLLWIGWTLIFTADSGAIRDADTGAFADAVDRLYYTGYAIFTMGNGDLEPGGNWRLVTVLMNASGIILLTLVVSYLFSVVSSVVRARSFAARVRATADSPQALVASSADEAGAQAVGQALSGFAADIVEIGQHHLAYPVLRFYHATDQRDAAPLSAALLADAIYLIRQLPDSRRPAEPHLAALDGAMERYVDALEPDERWFNLGQPPPPATDRLQAPGAVDPRSGDAHPQPPPYRARLHAVVCSMGWSWPRWTEVA